MRCVAGRLPVHFLLDIDGTLLHPLRGSYGNGDERVEGCIYACANGQGGSAAGFSEPVLCPLACEQKHIKRVLLRPHVIPFLQHLLLDRALDTARTQVCVSLYTRQSASYCEAVLNQVLLPALRRSRSDSPVDVTPALFHSLFHGDHAVQFSDSPCPSSPTTDASSLVSELQDWNKTVSVSPSPLTTVLIDDSSYNFRAAELTTGHAILLPSFRARADDDVDVDACFLTAHRCPEEAALYDAIRGETSGTAAAAAAAVGCGEVSEALQLLPLLEAFVQVCLDQRDVIEELQRALPFPGAYAAEVPALRQPELRARIRAHAAALHALNFFSASSSYRERWNRFHAAREDSLLPYV
ncbi:hypothetical protein ABB37_08740 [Leptomonas pyrrhocoris]|uniref:FCP1 homology domain-containing protein n=1 Tax=Leptomonas pyrrhocoris TaxID=157538 RepID=A0A0M9FSN7_LEPPY|nr:hypothetical protein ABB37_08740 [Leptomonas pyrrhocoris]KPA75056.1 hypothetical protein ABB37_08740 [Leptomonas pyrrhocoris]|eukprot:XP_015653495.1 hypothetical protein ABB37_08740 [Leptomonas pyrrhocoris]